jgi:hypothetical protein
MPQGIEEAPGVDAGRLHDIGRLGVRRSVFVAADASTNTTTIEETDATAIHRPARAWSGRSRSARRRRQTPRPAPPDAVLELLEEMW